MHSEIPADIALNAFDFIDKNECILYVPKESVSAYKEAKGWNYFTNIAEIPVKEKNSKDVTDNIIKSGTCGENLEWFLISEEDNYTKLG
jgi:hypothetical protein